MKLLLPVLLALLGLAGGVAAGHFLRPDPAPEPAPAAATGADAASAAAGAPASIPPADRLPGERPPPYDPTVERDYVRIDRQFLVPIVEREIVAAMMILSLSLEVEPGVGEAVLAHEPKLRDRFLQVMFRHAQAGGFTGVFTAGAPMRDLRGSLLEAARSVLGRGVHDVLVTDIMRQDF